MNIQEIWKRKSYEAQLLQKQLSKQKRKRGKELAKIIPTSGL
jgi:hypothetical protein